MKHIPNKIYLNIGCDPKDVEDFNDLSEVTWCADKINNSDIEYQRKPIWHDLRKNPNDLPKDDRIVLVISDYHVTTSSYCNSKWGYESTYKVKVLAWIDIPAFK